MQFISFYNLTPISENLQIVYDIFLCFCCGVETLGSLIYSSFKSNSQRSFLRVEMCQMCKSNCTIFWMFSYLMLPAVYLLVSLWRILQLELSYTNIYSLKLKWNRNRNSLDFMKCWKVNSYSENQVYIYCIVNIFLLRPLDCLKPKRVGFTQIHNMWLNTALHFKSKDQKPIKLNVDPTYEFSEWYKSHY